MNLASSSLSMSAAQLSAVGERCASAFRLPPTSRKSVNSRNISKTFASRDCSISTLLRRAQHASVVIATSTSYETVSQSAVDVLGTAHLVQWLRRMLLAHSVRRSTVQHALFAMQATLSAGKVMTGARRMTCSGVKKAAMTGAHPNLHT